MHPTGTLIKLLKASIILLFPMILFSQDVVEKIEVFGNVRIPRETIFHYLFVKEGMPLNMGELHKDFEALWSTGFFSDIKIEKEQGTKGKILKINVEENPFVTDITFNLGKKPKERDIIAWLKKKGEHLPAHSFYTSSQIRRIQHSIEEFLLERGFYPSKVDIVLEEKNKNAHHMVILIDPGEQIRVGKIVFEGDVKLPENILLSAMLENQEHGIESWLMRKDIFKKNKLDEDLASIKRELQEHGYMTAAVGEPKIEEITKRAIFPKTQVMKKITIPVYAGAQYFVGRVELEGNEALSKEVLEELIKLKKGHVYSVKTRDASADNMLALYREHGYLYARVAFSETLDHATREVHVRFNIFEGEVTYLNRLEFRGNTFVKDRIMRKKMLIRERDVFNFRLFEESLNRIGQLGILKLEKDPEIKPRPEDPTKFDVSIDIKEMLKSNYHFTGGYNGYGSLYVALDYATVNLLGKGEILHFTFEYGRKIKNYQHDLSEPYLLDYPVNFALSAYFRDNIVSDLFKRKGIGANITIGTRINGYWRTNLTYAYENVSVKLPEGRREGEDDFDPVFLTLYGLGKYNISSAIFSIFHTNLQVSTFPFRRNFFLASCKFAGLFLGGDFSLVKPRLSWSYFHPVFRSHKVGFYIDYQSIQALRDSPMPFWDRFYLGGDRSIRGYEIYSIGPRSEEGTNIGGERAIVLNAEYVFPVFEPFYAVIFHDRGNAYGPSEKISFPDMYSSTGLEIRIFYPKIPLPVRIIFAYNNRKIDPEDSRFSFHFTVGTYY